MRLKLLVWIIGMLLIAGSVRAGLTDEIFVNYNFDNNDFNDSTTNNYDAYNSGTINSTGIIQDGRYFDGVNDWVNYTASARKTAIAQGYTIAFWVKSTNTTRRMMPLGSQVDVNNFMQVNINYEAGGVSSGSICVDTRIGGTFGNNCDSASGSGQQNLTDGSWHFVALVWNSTGSGITYYTDGVARATRAVTAQIFPNIYQRIGTDREGTNTFNGNIDEWSVWNKTLTPAEILTQLYNSGNGIAYPFAVAPTITFTNSSPVNNDFFYYEPITTSIIFNSSDSSLGNCSLNYIDPIGSNWSIYDYWVDVASGSTLSWNDMGIEGDGRYTWRFCCSTITANETCSAWQNFTIDTIQPYITNNNPAFVNGTSWWQNISINFTINDTNNYEATFNVTRLADNVTTQTAYYNMTGYSVYNITATLNNQTLTGWYKFLLEAYDGHTAKKISDLSVDSKNKELKFSDSKSQVSITPVDKSLFSTATTTKKADRYTFEFTKDASKTNTKGYSDFIVEGGDSIEILSDSKYKGHVIIKKGGNPNDWFWADFETAQGCPVVVTRQNKNKVVARVYCGDADYKFNSIGRLNVNNLTIYYYFDASNIALAETYALQIVQGFPAYYYMQATYNPLKYNATLRVPSAVLSWNNTIYNATLINSSNVSAYFNFTTTPSGLTSFKTQIPHFWNFTIANQSNVSFYSATNPTNQSLYNITIAQCNASINNTIVNFTYFDEVTSTAIDAQNTYVATFYDGTYNYNLTGVFATGANHAFCTNLPASELEYSWLMYGTFTIENDTYLDRIYTFNLANGFTIGNYYNTTIPLSLIGANDSSTITYSWQTTSYQAITGMLEIYKCNANGSRQLVESTSIISGVAVANLVLLYQQYAYEVIIDGERYTGDYTTCHLESVTNPQYYVDIYGGDITTAIGLLLIDCKITQSGNNVTMLFSDIGGDSDLEGCLQVSRQDIYGVTNVTRECSNLVGEGTGQVTYSFPSDSNTYYAQGYIYQGDSTGYCTGLATYPIYQSNTEQTFGVSAIFAVFMIVLSMILIFSDNGEKMLGAGMFGFVVAFFLGVLTIPWALMSLLIAFCLIIALIGRYARKGAS